MRRTYEDMPALKYKVELSESERRHLGQIASRGETSARKVKRALVLLKADEGLIDRDIASGLLISASTVGRVRTRYVQEGLDSALIERPRPGQRRKLDGRQEAHLVAIACSVALVEHARTQLLAEGGGDGVCSFETVPRTQAVDEEGGDPEGERRVCGSNGGVLDVPTTPTIPWSVSTRRPSNWWPTRDRPSGPGRVEWNDMTTSTSETGPETCSCSVSRKLAGGMSR